MKRVLFYGLLAALLCLAQGSGIRDLLCENQVNPRGITTEHPQLSWTWIARSNPRGYQILVASSGEKLKADVGDLWDSGLVRTDQKSVKYEGKPLTSYQHCYWKVRVWSDYDTPTFYTEPATWQMGVLPFSPPQ